MEIIIGWYVNSQQDKVICDYMGQVAHQKSAKDLWRFYEDLVDWVEERFGETTTYDQSIRTKQNWGRLYHLYKDEIIDFNDSKQRLN